jgi:hypothetical protein
MSDALLAVHGSAYGTSGCREMFCPLVRFRREADMPRRPVAYRPVASDPEPTFAGSKSRSAAVFCHLPVACYP